MNDESAIVKREGEPMLSSLEHLAESISRSTIIPQEFRNNTANCLIALEMAHRIGAGVLQVMQSMYIVHGKPSWSGQFIIGAVNSTRRFTNLMFAFNEAKTECNAWARDREGNDIIGPTVSVEMAKKEGWWERNPKWKNLTELMLMYRAGTFFGRVFCPDVLMGMREQYEILEAEAVEIKEPKIPTHTKDIIAEVAGSAEGQTGEAPPAPPPVPPEPPKPPSPPAPKKTTAAAPKKKLQVKPKAAATTTNGSPSEKPKTYRQQLAERIAIGGFTEQQFLDLANYQGWLGKGKQWASMDDVPDDMFQVFLQPEEWPTVMEQLEATTTAAR